MAKEKMSLQALITKKYSGIKYDADMIRISKHELFKISMLKYIEIWYKTNTPSKFRRFLVWALKYPKGSSERKMKILYGFDKEGYNTWLFDTRSKRVSCKEYFLARGYSEADAVVQVSLSQKKINNSTTAKRVKSWHDAFDKKSQQELDIINKKKGVTLNTCIKKYGEIEGVKRWNEIMLKKDNTSIKSIMSRGNSYEDAVRIKKSINNKIINNSPACLEFWIKRCESIEDAKAKYKDYLNNRGHFSLDYCINKYGHDIGNKVFNERQTKWQNTLNSKSDDEIELICRKRTNRKNYKYWGLSPDTNGIFYALKLPNGYIKIGITYRTLIDRYNNSLLNDVEIIVSHTDTIEHCFMLEQLLKRDLVAYTIAKSDMVGNFGWTETFNIHIDDFMLAYNNRITSDIKQDFLNIDKDKR